MEVAKRQLRNTALLCDSKSEQDFVFLNDKKFMVKGISK